MIGTLYTGPDLRNAAAHSSVNGSFANSLIGLRNAAGVLTDVIRYRRGDTRQPRFELTRVSGTIAGGTEQMILTYAGHGINRDWCLATVFDRFDDRETRHITGSRNLATSIRKFVRGSNIVFAEGPAATSGIHDSPDALSLPAWIRQRVQTSHSWQSTVDGLRRGTRQEIARMLRKFEYSCRLTRDPQELDHFFKQLYQPYIIRRHGKAALLVDADRFLRECGRGVVLQLLRGQSVVAAALLRPIGNTMAVIWCGIGDEVAADNLRGSTDVLDYLSLLYANLTGCRWLDFGRSRPDLNDGIFRYKRKWGAEVTAGYVPQAKLKLFCAGRSVDERLFLKRHAFVCRKRRRFQALLFIEGDETAELLQRSIKRVATPGISEYRIISFAPVSSYLRSEIESLPHPVVLIAADSIGAALQAASR